MRSPLHDPPGLPEPSEGIAPPDSPEWLRRAARACQGRRILTTLGYPAAPLWVASVQAVTARAPEGGGWFFRWAWRRGVRDPWLPWRLLWHARRADVVLLYGGHRADLIYLAMAGLAPWITAPHLIVDAHWQPAGTAFKRWLQCLALRLARSLLVEVQVHSAEEIPVYAQNFGLPPTIIRPLPWSSSLRGYAVVEAPDHERRGIVSGGLSYRDYPVLIDAVRAGAWALHLGVPPSTEAESIRRQAQGLINFVHGPEWGNTPFWQRVAKARIFALPLDHRLQRATGDQSFLTAMALGAIVVVTDSISSRLYLHHGINGFVVREPTSRAWETVLREVLALAPEERERIRARARDDARRVFSEERRLVTTLERAAAAVDAWRKAGKASPRRLWLRRVALAGSAAGLSAIVCVLAWQQVLH